MADTLQQYRGLKTKLPTLLGGQFGFCKDTEELYIGGENGNVLIASGKWAETIANKLTATQSDAVAALAENATQAEVITAFNGLIANLKTANIMKAT